MTAMLEVRDIHTSYGHSRALFGVSIEVHQGECVCLLGRNGVGKTTTMRSIMGLTPPSAGKVLWKGKDITGWQPFRIARSGIGFVPEDRRVFADLTVDRESRRRGPRVATPGPMEHRGGVRFLSEAA